MMALATGVFAFGKQAQSTLSSLAYTARNIFSTPARNNESLTGLAPAQRPTSAPFSSQDGEIPQFAVYRQLFRHFVFLKEKAAEKEGRGEDGSSLRSFYKRKANFDEKQALALDQVATETDAAVTKLDEKAKKIIDKIRAKYSEGKLPKGEQPPPLPEELKVMQKQRTELILHGRDRLRESLGEQEFQRFDEYVQQNIASRMKPVNFNRPRPAFPNGPELKVGPRKHQDKIDK
jgi:hypothetical protein